MWRRGLRSAATVAAAAAVAWLFVSGAGDGGAPASRALAAASAAQGPSANPDAARVRADIEDALTRQSFPVRTVGDVIVVERDGAFHIVVPGVVIELLDGSEWDVGDIEIVAAPRPDGHYDATVVVPATMGVVDKGGAWATTLTIGEQRFEGVWAPEFALFVQVDAAYRDLRVAAADGLAVATAGAATIVVDYTETEPGLWGGATSMSLGELRIAAGDEIGRVTIDAIEVRSSGDGMRLAELGAFTSDFNAAMRRLEEPGNADAGMLALLRVFEAIPRLYASASGDATVTGVDVVETSGGRVFGLERVEFGAAIKGLDGERSHVEFRYLHDGLVIAGSETIASAFAPRRIVVDAAAVELPTDSLRQAIVDYIREAMTSTPDSAQAMLSGRLAAAFSDGASEVVVNSLTVEAPGMSLESRGALRADSTAALGAVGEFVVTIRGLDEIAASMSAMPQDPQTMQTVMMMAMVHALGEAGVDGAGAPTRRYRFEMTPDGTVLLNGNDIQTLFGALPFSAPPQ